MKFGFYVFVACIALSFSAQARPVSYPGGWTFMSVNDGKRNSTHIHYSPSVNYSIGWRHDYQRENSAHIDSVQLNHLLRRWNVKHSQANLYLRSGVGVAYEHGEVAPAAFTGIAADWETRRFFTSYTNRFQWIDDVGDSFAEHRARVGIAPYIGNHGDWHTWLMLETGYDAGNKDSFSVTPLIRLFKGDNLMEAGYNLDGGVQLNFIKRF